TIHFIYLSHFLLYISFFFLTVADDISKLTSNKNAIDLHVTLSEGIPDSRFPIPDSRFPIPDSRFPIMIGYWWALPISLIAVQS
ncbi:hypothetical protein, partial [Moorena sp. SIO3B2]|uniref:hypothetical protein n=1 Tax=Moorena sp. SIO3B2 TaxID=2607827 RepID=UPI0013CCA007